MSLTFFAICYLSFLLLLGIIIKSQIKIFNKFNIPASLIGGFLGLVLGPEFLNIPLNKDIFKEISLFPSILIIPIVASIPLGFNYNKETNLFKDTINMSGILLIITISQLTIGYIVNFLFSTFSTYNLPKTFGAELNSGFAGGHGTAGIVGRILQDLNLDYWNIAQGIATTTATVGLIGGLFLGLFLINHRKKTEIPNHIICNNISPSIKKEDDSPLSKNKNTDSYLLTISLIFSICGISYLITNFLKIHKTLFLSSLSTWSIAMILMFFTWSILKKFSLENLFNTNEKIRFTGLLTDFTIVSAITTLPLKAVFINILPIVVLCLIGFFFTYLILKKLTYTFFKNNYPFERFIAMLGTSLGVFFTGIIFLKICDKNFSTPVFKDYSISFSIISLAGPIFIATAIKISYSTSPLFISLLGIGLIFIMTFSLFIFNKK